MVGARCRRRAAAGERLGTSLVRADAPAARRGVVDRSAHEWVPEAEAARNIGGPDEIASQQLIERLDCGHLGHPRRGRDQLWLERITRNRSSFQHSTSPVGQQRELLGQRGGHRPRNLDAHQREVGDRRSGHGCAIQRPDQLLEVERIAAGLLVELVGDGGVDALPQKLVCLSQRQRSELETDESAGSMCPLEGGRQTIRRLPGARGHREKDGGGRRAPEESAQQLDRAGVGPVQVVENQDERLCRRKHLQQLARGPVGAIPLVLEPDCGAAAERGQAWEHVSKLRARLFVEVLDASWVEPLGVLVERVDEHPEGEIAFELGRRSGENEVPARVGAIGELAEQSGLSDSRLPDELDRGGAPLLEFRKDSIECAELHRSPDELLGHLGHRRPSFEARIRRYRALVDSQPAAGATDRFLRPVRSAARRQTATKATASRAAAAPAKESTK